MNFKRGEIYYPGYALNVTMHKKTMLPWAIRCVKLRHVHNQVYYINFPYTFDVNFPKGKKKFVVILQEGAIFKSYDSVVVLLITSDADSKDYGVFLKKCG